MQLDPDQVREWLRKADNDLRTAHAALALDPPATDTAAFHAQQTAEKLLKAFLVAHASPFERIHDLEPLVLACTAIDARFAIWTVSIAPLSKFAVRFRYPGPSDPTPDEVRDVLTLVGQFREFVVGRLPGGVLTAQEPPLERDQ
jgi:HEPN domain-containing protein